MALQDLLNLSTERKIGISEERIAAIVPTLRQYVSFWREYPDLFVDFLQTGGDPERYKTRKLKFYFYQRVFLRAAMRYKYVYMVFPRAYGKSFLSILVLMVRCVLYPGAKLFITAGGKEQSAGIASEKVQEICTLVPALEREINWKRGETKEGKDYVKYIFKNGSYIDNIVARETSRGKRRHSGLIEECVGVDGDILNSVIVPTMNIDRPIAKTGLPETGETLNKAQIYVTTAGYKGSFAYAKLIQLLIRMVIEPGKAFVMGGTYRIPVAVGLQAADFVDELKRDGTFNDATFAREYESQWAGSVEGSFFDGEWFDKNRNIQLPELERSDKIGSGGYYVFGIDVGRRADTTEITVVKVNPQPQAAPIQRLVNLVTMEGTIFDEQALVIRKMYDAYKPRAMVIDGNGLGHGLVDILAKPQYIIATDELLPGFGVINDDDGEFKKYRTEDTIDDVLYIFKANTPLNSEMYSNLQNCLRHGRLKLLVDENVAKGKLLETQAGKKMTPEQRADRLRPYNLTSVLKLQLLNLVQENDGANIILKQANKSIKKDKVSSLAMALYWIMVEENSKRKRKKRKFADFMFMT